MLVSLPAALRLILVSIIGTPGVDDSLANLNVNEYPAGVLAYVKATKRFYTLKKNLDTDVVADGGNYRNVVNSIGSSAVAGRWVAVQQQGSGTLVGGTLVVSGFDLTQPGFFITSLLNAAGTTGYVKTTKTTDATATLLSTSNSDVGTYGVVYVEGASA